MTSSEERRTSLLALTLTELAFILFFLLLLIAVKELHARDSKIEDVSKQERALREELEYLSTAFPASGDKKDFRALVRKAAEDHAALAGAEKQNSMLQEERDLARKEAEEARRQADEATEQAAAAQLNASERSQEKQHLMGQLKNLQRRAGKGGIGYPPCWADSEGKPEYIYQVSIFENFMSVEPAWMENRSHDATKIPGAPQLPGDELTLSEFAKRARPVLAWSQKQNPECRHFVVIVDHAVSKDAYKNTRLGIEDFFYKYERKH